MEKKIIYIKYDDIAMMGHEMTYYVESLTKKFENYPWGAGFRVDNFRLDGHWINCDFHSSIFTDKNSRIFENGESYIQGVLTGFLIAQGVEII